MNLIKNVNYWDGEVKVDEITVRTISDGDTLAMALQSGEIDAAYGMAYASYPLFENDNYKFTSIQTSRCFWGMMNLHKENSGYTIMSDPAVRKAIAMGINKQDFVDVLLNGYGYTATAPSPTASRSVRAFRPCPLIPIRPGPSWRPPAGSTPTATASAKRTASSSRSAG